MNEDRLPIILSPEADHDLLEIWERLSQAISAAIADKQLREIERLCLAISDWPEYGRSREDVRKGLRSVPVGRYVCSTVQPMMRSSWCGCWTSDEMSTRFSRTSDDVFAGDDMH